MATYVLSDVAGRFDEMMALIDQLPEPRTIIQLGDLVDRGTQSREVVEYFMAHPEHICLKGNHEEILLNDRSTWLYNGGRATLKSFGGDIPEAVEEWMRALPVSHTVELEGKKFYISHAPTPNPDRPWYEEPQILWNRYPPIKMPGVFLQIFGHNAKLEWFVDDEADETGKHPYVSVCIDDCHQKKLTAIELPSLKIYQQDYFPANGQARFKNVD